MTCVMLFVFESHSIFAGIKFTIKHYPVPFWSIQVRTSYKDVNGLPFYSLISRVSLNGEFVGAFRLNARTHLGTFHIVLYYKTGDLSTVV